MMACTPGPDRCGSAVVVRPVNSSRSIRIGPRSSAPAPADQSVSVARSRSPRSRRRAQNGHPIEPNAGGSGSRGNHRHRQLNAERDRNVLHVNENIEEAIALVRHDGDFARASVLAQVCD